jgi:hypothetical protein
MIDKRDDMPLGHNGYLKAWALTGPMLNTDYILLDEAQDTNPVVLGVLTGQRAQVVYVGDPYQQIYEWRGAVNAMDRRCQVGSAAGRWQPTRHDDVSEPVSRLSLPA